MSADAPGSANPSGAGERRLRIGVLGSGEGSNLRAILAAITAGTLQADIAVALSDQAGSRFLETARTSGIPALHVDGGPDPRRFGDSGQKEIAEHLQRADVDVVVLIGFMRILKEPTLSLYAGRIVNVHPSLLPKYKGAHAPRLAIEAGDSETGCTVHLVTAEIDSGAILAQATVPILPGDTPDLLHLRIKEQEHRLLPQVLADWKK